VEVFKAIKTLTSVLNTLLKSRIIQHSTYWAIKLLFFYEGESNENIKSAIKIRNTARLSFKLIKVLLMGWRGADRWQYDTEM